MVVIRVLCLVLTVKRHTYLDGTEPDEALAEEHPDPDSVAVLSSALNVLQLDDTDLVENVRQDLLLDDYETVPLTEDQRQVVEAEAGRATRVRLCTAECPRHTTPSTWAATLSEKIRRFLPLHEKWDQLKNSGQLASLCDNFEECVEECTEGTSYCEDLSKVEGLTDTFTSHIPPPFYNTCFSVPTALTSSTSSASATVAFDRCALDTAISSAT
jgi:hypothetical protein